MNSGRALPRGLAALLTIVLALAGSTGLAKPSASELMAGATPLYFEPNVGQTAADVRFLARGPGYTVFLTVWEAILNLQPVRNAISPADPPAIPGATLRLRLEGATRHPEPRIEGLERMPSVSHYLIGKDREKWRTAISHYQRVRYANVYPGIDLVYYGNPQRLEYDFIVAPDADPATIQMAISGVQHAQITPDGDLALTVPGGQVVQQAPHIYQIVNGQKQIVAGRYVLRSAETGTPATRIGFEVAQYDQRHPLVIDPILSYATYLGGIKDDYSTGLAVDTHGNAYVTGATASIDFPATANAVDPTIAGVKTLDAFVAKFDLTATGAASLIYATYLGGRDDKDDIGYAIAVDSNGYAYVTGMTASQEFPVTGGVLQGGKDAFVVILNETGGGPLFSRYLGGTKDDEGRGIAVHPPINPSMIYVTGSTKSVDFPLASAFQPALLGGADAFAVQLDSGGNLHYSTYLGGAKDDQGTAIAVDEVGHLYLSGATASTNFPVTGTAFDTTLGGSLDGFVTKIDPAATSGMYSLLYSTYLGGSGTDSSAGITVDSRYHAYVTGATASSNFPVTAGAAQGNYGGNGDAFITNIDPALIGINSLIYSTYLGGRSADSGVGIAITELSGAIHTYVTGATASSDFPVTANAYDQTLGGSGDAFIAQLNETGDQWLYATYLGGDNGTDSGAGIFANGSGIYVAGATSASDFPATDNAFDRINGSSRDAFVIKMQDVYYLVTTKAGAHGSINPAQQMVLSGAPASFTVIPEPGYMVTVSGCDGTLAGMIYTTGPITTDCTVNALFSVSDPATALITHYYTSILGRAPDAVGLSYWTDLIAGKQAQGEDVKPVFREMAHFFFNSPEYLGKKTSNTGFITDLYRTFFQREPDSGGMDFWLSQLANGMSRNDVMAGFLYSREFTTFMQSFGF